MSSQSYWSDYLESPTLSVMPHDFLRPRGQQQEPASFETSTTVDYFQGLTAFAALVFRLTGDDDVLIAAVNEDGKPFVVRVSVSATTTFGELKLKISEQYQINSLKETDFSELAWYIKRTKELDELPELFRLTYAQGAAKNGLQLSVEGSSNDIAIYQDNGKLNFHYNSLLYTEERIQLLAEQLEAVAQTEDSEAITAASLITKGQHKLPVPNSDLDWSGYRGAIHDIFVENAHKHPERTCVVETASPLDSSSETRTFTYKQINEASNVVAHYLVNSGVEVGDIVTLYSHRSVDLVVAVMGVLKAGGTFSVIDPAYPPARQNIYLSVAKPRALVVLERAGVLDQLVETYIKDELSLKGRLDALKISDDGSVTAAHSALDKINADQKLRSEQPQGVEIGPDNNPTLSFTSGSEGIPKGVLGRHFSLAYYFPCMSERFNLSENDRFTMLSGIAHDPIQRDIFTPLFLGAQLLVPTQDDIGTPGRLAEWMAEHKATVTHLTPAMGQLLSAQATAAFPLLHHAFFVGDILTKRDCLRLQTLAENVRIVNMYGTTETQRSVSYYELPSRHEKPEALKTFKDVVPAGSGMKNVQLLVVNRYQKSRPLSGVGEIGEIYVRAAGMAEGYRGLPALNAEKFVENWFPHSWEDKYKGPGKWLGPRDRLYRTGDLGRYLPDGNVECCGRADDQVKIRGFRIELGEIDTHISQHPEIRENITLVRKNDGESVLVTFFTPKDQLLFVADGDKVVEGIVRYSDLISDLKGYLRKRLASYAIPSFIVPYSSLPLNPNGKVDKPKLQLPTAAQLEAVSLRTSEGVDEDLTPLESQIKELWHEVLPNKPAIGKNDSFFDVGGHSILATRMIFAVRKQLDVDVPLGVIFKKPTLAEFSSEVQKAKDGDSTTSSDEQSTSSSVYSEDARELVKKLPASYKTRDANDEPEVFFLTGATGFLGSYILKDLLKRSTTKKVYCQVRANDKKSGLDRLRQSGKVYGVWDEELSSKIEVVLGDLSKAQFGLSSDEWNSLAKDVDAVIHNGAMVHWVYPYAQLRDANVIGSLNVMSLCETGKAKNYSFVSSTSVLDTEHYFKLSDKLVLEGKDGILESDDLEGSASGLGTGYGQLKWTGEYLTRQAGKRGLAGAVIRPGYVTGAVQTGCCNTDDFLLRILKGCLEIGYYPNIKNTVNLVPVDHVALVVVATALTPPVAGTVEVAQVTGHPRETLSKYLENFKSYGYDVEEVTYNEWKQKLQAHIEAGKESALYPLLHMVLGDLPADSRAPELSDVNAVKSLAADAKRPGQLDNTRGRGVDLDQLGVYVSFLTKIGYLPKSTTRGLELPQIRVSQETIDLAVAGAGSRGSAAK